MQFIDLRIQHALLKPDAEIDQVSAAFLSATTVKV